MKCWWARRSCLREVSKPTPRENTAVVLFDGVCNFCNRSVNWIINRDKRQYFRFAPLQSRAGADLQERYSLDPGALDTLVLIERGRPYVKSTAALRILRHVQSPWRLLYALTIVPRPFRDFAYDWFARRRYRWFGKRNECMVPTPEVRERFLTDESPSASTSV